MPETNHNQATEIFFNSVKVYSDALHGVAAGIFRDVPLVQETILAMGLA